MDLAHNFDMWSFDIIGYSSSDFMDIPNNVTFHGILTSDDYKKILSESDVAIGSLSLHINNMNEACTLKVREYLAFGIPTIIGYKDSDFPGSVPFLLELP